MRDSAEKPILLAPAGSPQALKAAVYNGADAVYLGLNKFNARLKAENFTLENLSEWIEFCHLYGVEAVSYTHLTLPTNSLV